ncbi:MAG: PQQ-like beta-propeller repeat protein [Verrucomicrobia bacterium]|nr:PQQ-like beta-propeller repeat protein [Verrucomicrobiota bacterium]MBM3869650.1 PQQ-like beta-propeller repeat protein [Verrucomicrobiota bacterium]
MRYPVFHIVLLASVTLGLAADWPMFRGPDLNGISRESGWASSWSGEGPKVAWRARVGLGFSTVVVGSGKLITTGHDGRAKGQDTVWCLDAVTGKELWKHSYDAPLGNKYFEGGTTGTPTIDGDRVFHLSRRGDFFCLELETGKVVYQKQLVTELGVEVPEWGFSSSPLVEGKLVILNVGSHGTALDKTTGKIVWQNGKGSAAYATAVPFDVDGTRCVALLTHRECAAVEIATGKMRWTRKFVSAYNTSACAPVVHDGALLLSGEGAPAVKLNLRDGAPVTGWKTATATQFNSGVVLDGHLYTFHGLGGKSGGELRCLDWSTGTTKWAQTGLGVGSLMAADGKLIVLSESGELLTAAANPQKFDALARAQVVGRKCWIVPVLAGGRIYLRNVPGDLVCVDVSGR